MSTPSLSSWPYCGHDADPATDPADCRGNHVPGQTSCFAHLTDAEPITYLSGLTPSGRRRQPLTTYRPDGARALTLDLDTRDAGP